MTQPPPSPTLWTPLSVSKNKELMAEFYRASKSQKDRWREYGELPTDSAGMSQAVAAMNEAITTLVGFF